jgi:hypothetical protein
VDNFNFLVSDVFFNGSCDIDVGEHSSKQFLCYQCDNSTCPLFICATFRIYMP